MINRRGEPPSDTLLSCKGGSGWGLDIEQRMISWLLKNCIRRFPDGGTDRRKFDKGPLRYPEKHVPGRVPELGKKVGRGVSRVDGSTLMETSLSCK